MKVKAHTTYNRVITETNLLHKRRDEEKCTTSKLNILYIYQIKQNLKKNKKNVKYINYKYSRCTQVKVKSLSHVQLFATPWTVASQVPPSMGFSRQEYCNGLPFPSPGDLPDPGIEHGSPSL